MPNKIKKKKFRITIPLNFFSGNGKAIIPELKRSAKRVIDELHKVHFNPKVKHGWPIGYQSVMDDVFYDAYGHHLESYVVNELMKYKCYGLKADGNSLKTLLYKIKPKKSKQRKKHVKRTKTN